jgi:Peptidase A4 family
MSAIADRRSMLLLTAVVVTLLTLSVVPASGERAPNAPVPTTLRTVHSQVAAGYVGNITTGTLTKVSGKWNLPVIRCNASDPNFQMLSIFMGLLNRTGGAEAAVLVVAICVTGETHTPYTLLAKFPSDPNFVNMSITVKAGDTLKAYVAVNPTTHSAQARVDDITSKQVATRTGTSHAKYMSAEWIASRYQSTDLAVFSPAVTFNSCTVVRSGTTIPLSHMNLVTKFVMVDAGSRTVASTSALSSTGTRFRLTFVRPN